MDDVWGFSGGEGLTRPITWFTGDGPLVFPSPERDKGPLSSSVAVSNWQAGMALSLSLLEPGPYVSRAHWAIHRLPGRLRALCRVLGPSEFLFSPSETEQGALAWACQVRLELPSWGWGWEVNPALGLQEPSGTIEKLEGVTELGLPETLFPGTLQGSNEMGGWSCRINVLRSWVGLEDSIRILGEMCTVLNSILFEYYSPQRMV